MTGYNIVPYPAMRTTHRHNNRRANHTLTLLSPSTTAFALVALVAMVLAPIPLAHAQTQTPTQLCSQLQATYGCVYPQSTGTEATWGKLTNPTIQTQWTSNDCDTLTDNDSIICPNLASAYGISVVKGAVASWGTITQYTAAWSYWNSSDCASLIPATSSSSSRAITTTTTVRAVTTTTTVRAVTTTTTVRAITTTVTTTRNAATTTTAAAASSPTNTRTSTASPINQSAVSTLNTFKIANRVLLISITGGTYEAAPIAGLKAYAIPYTLSIGLPSSLVDAQGRPLYSLVVFATSAAVTALTAPQVKLLETYESTYRVRRVVLGTFPSPTDGTAAVGAGTGTTEAVSLDSTFAALAGLKTSGAVDTSG
ncbi:hypothetical protein M427DRAFT_34998 [Gonapodya prolifera JEL478]|uniref:Agd3 CBM87 domain-containing protein n=1 Tax=Gonapodya prolifera (strain JEL478) TaxID=1344416 RepID=A0A139A6L8_GONPJ|nr:hypothetical protein M427DRAFT_34998 [Gonapodya prolifera JEL478]|eukprot:KXS12095.1 hypothetical protein M427DRAFT_34998 [Gonapodya prolifera JEL478]